MDWWDDLSLYDTGPSNPGGESALTPDTQYSTGGTDVTSGATTPSGDSAINTGGLDGPLGDSAANYKAGMGFNATDAGKTSDSNLSAWVKGNKEVAAALAQGILGALGGAGAAALNKSTMKDKAALELQNAKELADAKVARTSAGAFKGSLGMGPAGGGQPLTRSDGTPVYDASSGRVRRPPGLINANLPR